MFVCGSEMVIMPIHELASAGRLVRDAWLSISMFPFAGLGVGLLVMIVFLSVDVQMCVCACVMSTHKRP